MMSVKGILRNSAVKAAAFLAVVACFAGALFITESTLISIAKSDKQNNTGYYDLDASFRQSDVLRENMDNITYALWYGLDQGWTQEEFDSSYAGDTSAFVYYAKMGECVLKNADLTEEQAAEYPAYLIATPEGQDANFETWADVFSQYGLPDVIDDTIVYSYKDSEIPVSYPDGTILMIGMTGEKYAALEKDWNAQRAQFLQMFRQVAALFVVAVLLYIYLLCTVGRKKEDNAVHLLTIDRMFVEFDVILGGGALLAAAAFNLAVLEENVRSGEDVVSFLWRLSCILFAAMFAAAMELSLSIARNIKNRTLLSRSLCARLIRRCWRIAVRAAKGLWNMARQMAGAVFAGYKTRNVLLAFTGYSAVLALLAAGFILCAIGAEDLLCALVLICGVLWWLAAGYFLLRRIAGFGKIVEALRRLRGGETDYKLTEMPAGVLGSMAEDINSLGDGMQVALQKAIRAERMKSELITNVSHDLKTPLTSILSYSELLCKEQLTPEEANDYAKIIYQKGLRLKNMTSDLFDISKVQSGVETAQCERLDACTLVRQALAEQGEALESGGLIIKTRIPDEELPIWADGGKMSRVLENLLGNCVKYALKGTRVFVTVAGREDTVTIEVKNTANYAMDFDAEEITERFVRGDAARSTEGSGLGLAIAKSYTEACGGEFSAEVDGDQFKTRICFARYSAK